MTVGVPTDVLVLERALDAGAAVMRRGRGHVGTLVPKGDRDFATAVDLQVEQAICDVLERLAPGVPFLGEERGGPDLSEGGAVWVLDPIDGTMNFARDSPLCGISLALVEGGRPRLAVVDLPFLGERHVAAEGAGAFLDGHRLRVADVGLHDAIVGLSDFSVGRDAPAENPLHLRVLAALAPRALRVRLHGSEALDLAWTAAGRLGATIMLSNLPWDVSGGVLLAREAGGVVCDLAGADHGLASASTVACAPRLADELLAVLAGAHEGEDPCPP